MTTPQQPRLISPREASGRPDGARPAVSAEHVLEELGRTLEAHKTQAGNHVRTSDGLVSSSGSALGVPQRLTPQQLLAQRAEQLAQVVESSEEEDCATILVLQVGDEQYGIEVHEALEILVLTRITPLPGIAAYWKGLINLRGRLFPVLDLAAFLGLGSTGLHPGARAVLVGRGDLCIGLLAARASTVVQVPRSQLGPSISSTLGLSRELIRGVTRDSVSLLSVDALLNDARLEVEEDVD